MTSDAKREAGKSGVQVVLGALIYALRVAPTRVQPRDLRSIDETLDEAVSRKMARAAFEDARAFVDELEAEVAALDEA